MLVPPTDARALADALVAILGDLDLARRLGAGATASAAQWVVSPDEFAARMLDLVTRSIAQNQA